MLVTDGGVVWADRSDDPSRLPDSRGRWSAIWKHRDALQVIAHTHPHGPLAFSATDRTTMDGLDAALGHAQTYAVVAPSGTIWRRDGEQWRSDDDPEADEPWWVDLIRWASGIGDTDR
jgi:hypothetical protein